VGEKGVAIGPAEPRLDLGLRQAGAKVALWKRRPGAHRTAEEAPGERLACNDAEPVLDAEPEQALAGALLEEVHGHLDAVEPSLPDPRLDQPQVFLDRAEREPAAADEALGLQLVEHVEAAHVEQLARKRGVREVEIDVVGAEADERLLERPAALLG